tara:strand:- start:14 stop:250 length:237 start_codon:yes stop_codon:yes gene_type:complete
MEHQQSGISNISFQIESFCYKLMKKLFCMVYPEESDEYFEEIDLEKPSVAINDYTPLIRRNNNNINIEQIIIEDYFQV